MIIENDNYISDIIASYFNNMNYGGNCKNYPDYKKLNKHKKRFFKNNLIKSKIESQLLKLFNDYVVIDWTDYEESFCYQYKVLLHKNQDILDDDIELLKVLGDKRYDLHILFSMFNNFFYYYVEQTTYNVVNENWEFKKINCNKEVKKSMEFFSILGFNYIESALLNKDVLDLETKYLECGKVKIFNCLFNELLSFNLIK